MRTRSYGASVRPSVARFDRHLVRVGALRDVGAEVAEHGEGGANVGQRRHVPQDAALGRQQGREQQRQGGVLRPAHLHLALQHDAATDHDAVHVPTPLFRAPTTRAIPAWSRSTTMLV